MSCFLLQIFKFLFTFMLLKIILVNISDLAPAVSTCKRQIFLAIIPAFLKAH